MEKVRLFRDRIISNVAKVMVGKEYTAELLLIALLCDGHVLLEDVPGTGKTMLVKAFARSFGAECKRIQFTPDLLPSDLTGINFYNQKSGEFVFRPGPLFTNMVIADEINRATPRTQSSLLEAMEERQITVDGETRYLEEPFMVLATQNPLESQGVFPLPEAQLDRFFMRISMGYPEREQELEIIRRFDGKNPLAELAPVSGSAELNDAKAGCLTVRAQPEVMGYLLDIVNYSRNSEKTKTGASPRAAQALYRGSQACAALQGRSYIIPEDIKRMAVYMLNHRVTWKLPARRTDIYAPVRELLDEITVPGEEVFDMQMTGKS